MANASPRAKKVRAVVRFDEASQVWIAEAADGSESCAHSPYPAVALATLRQELREHYRRAVLVTAEFSFPDSLNAQLGDLRTFEQMVQNLVEDELPTRRAEVAFALMNKGFNQLEISNIMQISQGYVSRLLKAECARRDRKKFDGRSVAVHPKHQ